MMNMTSHDVAFHYLTLSLLGKITEYLSKIFSKLTVQGLSSVFGNEYHMVLAIPNRMF